MAMVDDSDGTDIIQFGLAKKSQDVLQAHMKGLANLESSIKAMVKPGAGGAFSGKFLQIAEQQLIYQRDIAAGIRQLNMQATKGAGLVRQQYQKHMKDYMDLVKRVGNAGGSGSGSAVNKNWGDRIWDAFAKMGNMMKGAFKVLQRAWDKTAGKVFKKTGAMGLNKLLGLGGATIIGALVGKMISSSPLLQAMFKILNTSLTLIMRPIGDFFGSFFRPMFIYFLKEVAIPFFQKGRGWMNEGEKWGRIAVGFFIDPIQAIKSGALLAFKEVPLFNLLASANAVKEAEFFQKDPAGWLRASEGLDPLPAFMGLGATEQIEENIEEITTMTTELEVQTAILEDIRDIEADLKATIQAGADPKYAGMSAMEIFRAQNPGYSNISDSVINKTAPWTQENIGSSETIFTRDAATQQAIVDAIDESLGDLKEETSIMIGDRNPYGTFESSIYNYVRRIVYEHKGDGPIEWLAKAWEDFWAKGNIQKFTGFLGAKMMDPLSAFLPPVAAANEPFDEVQYHADRQLELFENITRSFDTIEDWNQQSAESAQGFFFNVSKNQMSTADAIDHYSKRITDTYQVTDQHLYDNADQLKERLHKVYTIYEAISRNADLISINDQVIADARALNMELNLGLTEDMLTSTTQIKTNFGMMADVMKTTAFDVTKFQYIMHNSLQESTGAILKTTDDVMRILTGEGGTLASDYNKMIATQGGNVQGPMLAGGGAYGIGATVGGTTGGSPSALDTAYAMQRDILGLGDYSDIYGGGNQLDIMMALAAQGKSISATGQIQEFSRYLGPEGQSVDTLSKVPSITGPQGSLIMDPNWTKAVDAENAIKTAIANANRSAMEKLNEATALIAAGTSAFTNASEAAVYVSAGGGMTGLAAVNNMTGGQSSGIGIGHWSTTQSGALSIAINESKKNNPDAWQATFGGSFSGAGGGSGSGHGSNYSGSSNPGAAAAAAGYSTGSATAQWGGIIDEPIIGIGLHSGKEWSLGESGHELVTPLSQLQGGGGEMGNIIINIGNISEEADYTKLKPLIQRWILEASSRRGMV